jgi:hypothetical protein
VKPRHLSQQPTDLRFVSQSGERVTWLSTRLTLQAPPAKSPGNVHVSRTIVCDTASFGLLFFVTLLIGWRVLSALFGGSSGPDHEGAAGCLDDVVGESVEVVDLQDAVDLGEQSLDEAEVAAGDPGDGGDGWASV